jgi:hypothetical protein
MPNDIHVRPAETVRDRRAIVTFPWRIYRNDPLWVPPLISERLARLDPERNPFFQAGEAQPFLAYRQGKLVGTIVPAIDHRSNRTDVCTSALEVTLTLASIYRIMGAPYPEPSQRTLAEGGHFRERILRKQHNQRINQ